MHLARCTMPTSDAAKIAARPSPCRRTYNIFAKQRLLNYNIITLRFYHVAPLHSYTAMHCICVLCATYKCTCIYVYVLIIKTELLTIDTRARYCERLHTARILSFLFRSCFATNYCAFRSHGLMTSQHTKDGNRGINARV